MMNLSFGKYVELYFLELIEEILGSRFRQSTEEEDLYEGADFYIDDVPIDITLNPSKRRTKYLNSFMLDGITINVSVRYGNAVSSFSKPSLVLHIDTYDIRDRFLVCEYLEENLSHFNFDKALNLYKEVV